MDIKGAYALLIGVGDDLPATVRDAKALEKVLKDEKIAGYDSANVFTITEKNASRENVLKHLDKLIDISKTDRDSTIVVFYSGHGICQYDDDDNEAYYLKTYGGDEDNAEYTMVNGDLFAEKINQIESQRILVLLDCCNAAGIRRTQQPSGGETDQYAEEGAGGALLNKLRDGNGRVFLSSCQDNEVSLILDKENSLFTSVLIEALYGVNSHEYEYVHVVEVVGHIMRKVVERSMYSEKGIAGEEAKTIARQNPMLSNVENLDSNFFICANSSYKTTAAVNISGKEVLKTAVATVQEQASQYNISIQTVEGDLNIGGNVSIEKFIYKEREIDIPNPIPKEFILEELDKRIKKTKAKKAKSLAIWVVLLVLAVAVFIFQDPIIDFFVGILPDGGTSPDSGNAAASIAKETSEEGTNIPDSMRNIIGKGTGAVFASMSVPDLIKFFTSKDDSKDLENAKTMVNMNPLEGYVNFHEILRTQRKTNDLGLDENSGLINNLKSAFK